SARQSRAASRSAKTSRLKTLTFRPATSSSKTADSSDFFSMRRLALWKNAMPTPFSGALEQEGGSLAAADAKRGQTTLQAPSPQLLEQRDHQARARCSNGMTQGNRAAVH